MTSKYGYGYKKRIGFYTLAFGISLLITLGPMCMHMALLHCEAAPLEDPTETPQQFTTDPSATGNPFNDSYLGNDSLVELRRKSRKYSPTGNRTLSYMDGTDCRDGSQVFPDPVHKAEVDSLYGKLTYAGIAGLEHSANLEAQRMYGGNCASHKCYFKTHDNAFICSSTWIQPMTSLIMMLYAIGNFF